MLHSAFCEWQQSENKFLKFYVIHPSRKGSIGTVYAMQEKMRKVFRGCDNKKVSLLLTYYQASFSSDTAEFTSFKCWKLTNIITLK